MEKIENILKNTSCICGYKDLKARKVGRCKYIEVTIFFEPDWKILECHNICDDIENKIKEKLENVSIVIHSEPKKQVEKRVGII
jgi:divalent metal cation (Fe/Co/Zn/Cd) transporter